MRYLASDTAKRISKIGLGTWQFGSREWGYGDAYAQREAHAITRRALELGITLFDTAEIYGFGRSERILGEALGEDAASVFVATKILPVLPIAPVVEQRGVASANRLGVRRLDLYQVHQPNPVIRDGTIMRGMRALQRVGLVGDAGVSNYSLDRWRAAEAALGSRVLSNQVRYSLVARSPERDLIPFAESQEHMVIAYSPLAQGLLSGRYTPNSRPANRLRAASSLFLPENLERAGELISALRDHPGSGRAGLGHPQSRGRRYPGRFKRRTAGTERRRRRRRPDRRRVPGTGRRVRPVPSRRRSGRASRSGPGQAAPLTSRSRHQAAVPPIPVPRFILTGTPGSAVSRSSSTLPRPGHLTRACRPVAPSVGTWQPASAVARARNPAP